VDKGTSIDVDAQGYVYVLGVFSGNARFGAQRLHSRGSEDIFLMRMQSDGSVAQDPGTEVLPMDITIWPNPTDQVLHFNVNLDRSSTAVIQITDLAGRALMQQDTQHSLHPGTNSISVSTRHLQAGMYCYSIVAGNQRSSGRFAVVR
jgi:hypothetical protein